MSPLVSRSGASRGQTLPDFAIGVTAFLLTVVFVSVFVPQLILPFDDQEQPVVTERIASDLGNENLTEPDSPSELNESKTRGFFNRTEEEVLDQSGIPRGYAVNVTIRNVTSRNGTSEIRCADPTSDPWLTDCNSGMELSVGDPVPTDERSVSTSRRALFTLESEDEELTYVILEVSVW